MTEGSVAAVAACTGAAASVLAAGAAAVAVAVTTGAADTAPGTPALLVVGMSVEPERKNLQRLLEPFGMEYLELELRNVAVLELKKVDNPISAETLQRW